MTKRLLFVTSRLPWPQNSGRKVSLYHYCRGLAEVYGYEVTLFVFPEHDQPRESEGKPDFIKRVVFSAPISRLTKAMHLGGALLCGTPLQCALFASRKNKKALDALVLELAPDVIMFDMIRTAPYMKRYQSRARLVLDLDDLLSLRYKRQLLAGATKGIAGRYEGALTRPAKRLLRGTLGRLVLATEARRVARAEKRFARMADGVILVSAKEAADLNRTLGESKAVAVPTGVDIAALLPATQIKKAPRTVGFMGNLSVPANVASLDYIAREVLPLLPSDVTLEVVGYAPDALRARYADTPQISFLGEVCDLAAALGRFQAFLSPIAFGTGLKTKILDAMAAGLPVITNAVGAEGIGAANGKELFVLESAAEQALAVTACLTDSEKAAEIGAAARAFVAANFAWEHCFTAFSRAGF